MMPRGAGGMASPSSSSSMLATPSWIEIQNSLKKRLIKVDDFPWKLPLHGRESKVEGKENILLKYVGGVDVSFSKEDPSVACGALVVLDLNNFSIVYADYSVVTLHVPYVAGFLAFREAPILLKLLEKLRNSDKKHFYPQLIMVDGNGLLHPRGFGLACHLGVLANIPSIGVGKNLHYVDGLSKRQVDNLLLAKENVGKSFISLIGRSGKTWGAVMRPMNGSLNAIFISIGHRISLDTALMVVKMTCKYRVPEPIRLADKRSRSFIQTNLEPALSLEQNVSWKNTTAIDLFDELVASGFLSFPACPKGEKSRRYCRWHSTSSHTTDRCHTFRNFLIKKVSSGAFSLTDDQCFAMKLEDFLISKGTRLLKSMEQLSLK